MKKKHDVPPFEVNRNRSVPFYKKFLGIPQERRNGQLAEGFAATTADGYTILDTDRLVGSKKFRDLAQQLDAFKLDSSASSNGNLSNTPKEDSSELA